MAFRRKRIMKKKRFARKRTFKRKLKRAKNDNTITEKITLSAEILE